MFHFRPLLAFDWVEIIIFLFIVISSLIGQLFKSAKSSKKAGRPQPKANPRPVAQRPAPAERVRKPARVEAAPIQTDAGPTTLEKEIEAFLRQHRTGQAADRPPAPPGRKPTPSRPPAAPKPRPVPVEEHPVHESVEQYVQRTVRTGEARRDAARGGGEWLDQADERLEVHLQQVFQHNLGQLGSTTAAQPGIAAGTDAAVWDSHQAAYPLHAQLYQMLSTPQHVRTAIVLSEILRRPEDPWA
jgi:hypothetical protein